MHPIEIFIVYLVVASFIYGAVECCVRRMEFHIGYNAYHGGEAFDPRWSPATCRGWWHGWDHDNLPAHLW